MVLSSKLLTVIVCLAPVLQDPPSASFHSVLMFILYRPAWSENYVEIIHEISGVANVWSKMNRSQLNLWEGNKKLSSEEVVVRFHLRLCWFQAIYLAGIAR